MIEKCPICGNEPQNLCYTSLPEQYGYSCCTIHGGYNSNWHEAERVWNKAVEEYKTVQEGGRG